MAVIAAFACYILVNMPLAWDITIFLIGKVNFLFFLRFVSVDRIHPTISLTFLTRTHWELMVNLSTRTPRSFLQSSSIVGQSPSCDSEWGYSSHGAGRCSDLCWTSLSFSLSNNLAYQDLTEWWHILLVYQPLLTELDQQQTCWGSSLSLYPSHWCSNYLHWTLYWPLGNTACNICSLKSQKPVFLEYANIYSPCFLIFLSHNKLS